MTTQNPPTIGGGSPSARVILAAHQLAQVIEAVLARLTPAGTDIEQAFARIEELRAAIEALDTNTDASLTSLTSSLEALTAELSTLKASLTPADDAAIALAVTRAWGLYNGLIIEDTDAAGDAGGGNTGTEQPPITILSDSTPTQEQSARMTVNTNPTTPSEGGDDTTPSGGNLASGDPVNPAPPLEPEDPTGAPVFTPGLTAALRQAFTYTAAQIAATDASPIQGAAPTRADALANLDLFVRGGIWFIEDENQFIEISRSINPTVRIPGEPYNYPIRLPDDDDIAQEIPDDVDMAGGMVDFNNNTILSQSDTPTADSSDSSTTKEPTGMQIGTEIPTRPGVGGGITDTPTLILSGAIPGRFYYTDGVTYEPTLYVTARVQYMDSNGMGRMAVRLMRVAPLEFPDAETLPDTILINVDLADDDGYLPETVSADLDRIEADPGLLPRVLLTTKYLDGNYEFHPVTAQLSPIGSTGGVSFTIMSTVDPSICVTHPRGETRWKFGLKR